MAIEKYYATVSQEGESGPIRGKIPTGLARQLGAESGDMIEFEAQGRKIIGGRVLTEKEANRVKNSREAVAPVKSTPKVKAKTKAKAAPEKTKKSAVGKTKTKASAVPAKTKAKSNGRKTKVNYEEPVSIKKPNKNKVKFGKKKK